MAHNETTYDAQLTLIQSAITAALTNPRPNYRVGEVSYNHADYLKMLFEQQKEVIKMMTEVIPQESIVTWQTEMDGFGQDLTRYANEPNI